MLRGFFMEIAMAKTTSRKTAAYRNGRVACLNSLAVADNPHRSAGEVTGNRRRVEWFEGYYDQFFGEKWELNEASIEKRVWPVHI